MAAQKKSEGQAFGVFSKDGERRIAQNVDEAVYYRFNGWAEDAPASPENRLETPAEQ